MNNGFFKILLFLPLIFVAVMGWKKDQTFTERFNSLTRKDVLLSLLLSAIIFAMIFGVQHLIHKQKKQQKSDYSLPTSKRTAPYR